MALFDRIKQVAGQVADNAQRQVEIIQDQGKIGRLQEEIDKNLIEAGKRAREMVRTKKLADSELMLTLTRIEALEAEIEEVRAQVQSLQQPAPAAPANVATPPMAAETVPATPPQVVTATPPVAVTPTAPTTPPASPAQPAAGAQTFCSSCGAKVAEGAKFCAGCGAKLE
jgi:hypothetical protein